MSDIQDLFDRDPLSLTDQDIQTCIARLREARNQFELGVKQEKPKKPAASAALLKDLGLE